MRWPGIGALLLLLSACAGPPPAPVEERSSGVSASQSAPRSGAYRVRRGDTLLAIAFDHGVDYRDLARWNGLSPPYTIYPDQTLRLTAPPGGSKPASTTGRKRTSPPAEPAPSSGTPSGRKVSPPQKPPTPPAAADVAVRWQWPVQGRVLRGFLASDPARNGIDITVAEGTSVRAAAAGRVVYSGSGLIGYGELIIVKHNDRWLSAYGHNRRRLVAEGETVAPGQVIAESGRNDRDESLLHFEIRAHGKPVNPLDHLPASP